MEIVVQDIYTNLVYYSSDEQKKERVQVFI